MNIENDNSSALGSDEKSAHITIGIVGGGNNLKDIITSELTNPKNVLLLNALADIDRSLSEKFGDIKDSVIDKPVDIDSKKKPNKVKFYKPFVQVSKDSKHRIK